MWSIVPLGRRLHKKEFSKPKEELHKKYHSAYLQCTSALRAKMFIRQKDKENKYRKKKEHTFLRMRLAISQILEI